MSLVRNDIAGEINLALHLCIAPILAGDFDQLEQIGIRRVAAALVAGGEDEATVRGAVVDQALGLFLHLFGGGTQHEFEGVDIAL